MNSGVSRVFAGKSARGPSMFKLIRAWNLCLVENAHRDLRSNLAIQQHGTGQGPSNYLSLLVNRARMEGIVVFDYAPRYKEGAMQLGQ